MCWFNATNSSYFASFNFFSSPFFNVISADIPVRPLFKVTLTDPLTKVVSFSILLRVPIDDEETPASIKTVNVTFQGNLFIVNLAIRSV